MWQTRVPPERAVWRRRTTGKVTIKERLHRLVDELSEPEADEALRYIAQRHVDPMVAAFRDAPEDGEPVTATDDEALAAVQADRANDVPRARHPDPHDRD